MADVVNRATTGSPPVGTALVDYRQSVNTPEFPVANWIINPNLTALAGVARRYWKIVAGTVVEMTQPEKDSVDAALAPNGQIDVAYAAAVNINMRDSGGVVAVGQLTGNIAFDFINVFPGSQIAIYVRQDAGGSHTVTFNAPVGWTLQDDVNLADLQAGATGDQVTAYAVAFIQVGGLSLMHVGKTILS